MQSGDDSADWRCYQHGGRNPLAWSHPSLAPPSPQSKRFDAAMGSPGPYLQCLGSPGRHEIHKALGSKAGVEGLKPSLWCPGSQHFATGLLIVRMQSLLGFC